MRAVTSTGEVPTWQDLAGPGKAGCAPLVQGLGCSGWCAGLPSAVAHTTSSSLPSPMPAPCYLRPLHTII